MTIEARNLLENEEFLKGLVEANTPVELEEVLKKNNIQLEEGLTAEAALQLVKDAKNDDLSDSDLENVSGGILVSVAVGAIAAFVLGGSALAFFAGYGYQKFRNIWGLK